MLDKKAVNELKILALETISNAGSGHSGSVLSCGDILYTLYTKHLLSNQTDSILRDRFVLSNGHASAMLYAILGGLGYFNLEELKNFRKYNGMLTGHPEIEIPGVDASTGPLGQGVGNAVGMAIAETMLNKKFKLDHYTYCMAGDGCLLEGVAWEALSIAGLYKLNRFILLYDCNKVTLDGNLIDSSNDNIKLKFKSINFNVIECDGHNILKIDKAINNAKKSDKPTVIIFNTIIGKDTSLANSNKSHGKVFSEQEIAEIRKNLKVVSPKLNLSEDVKSFLKEKNLKIVEKFEEKVVNFNKFLKNNKKIEDLYIKFINNDFKFKIKEIKENLSTREINGKILNDICSSVENIVVLNADLSSSTKVRIVKSDNYSINNREGRNINLGIREHAMGSIANGIALHKGLRVITSTFLTFSNYMMPAIRMACIMKLPVMFTFTHSNCYETDDGVTHLPVEQLEQLRIMPDCIVCRPANFKENKICYDWWYEYNNPLCLSLSRAKVLNFATEQDVSKGMYYIEKTQKADLTIMSSGSEVEIAMQVKDLLKEYKINLISVPSLEIYENTPAKDKLKINQPLFVIESSTCYKYLKYTPDDKIFSIRKFSKTGDVENLKNENKFSAEKIAENIKKIMKKL